MGCVVSKKAAPATPVVQSAGASGSLELSGGILNPAVWNRIEVDRSESGDSGKLSSNGTYSQSFRLGNFHKQVEGEQVAAGWPSWLSGVAREAIHGWLPLKAESFEKLEKIGQGTYSSVFRARDLDTGKIVALKKVHFDNYEPESIRFMAREICVLRRLNHPNVIKLEGLITSKLSCSVYLVFEYMEHNLAGLSSSPNIIFSESQVKCYMHQLLSGLEHCHSRGIMHRDIKCSNLLLNNEGILKIADFGLANFFNPINGQQLTTRVVTLWYRPPELLLGAIEYQATVDLWSVGCVFAELFLKKPILQGKTEVEQIHNIFKLCGSPPDEYWGKSGFPNETDFKPRQMYQSCLRETLRCVPKSAFDLLQTFLSIEPYKRSTAAAALSSEYFKTMPYACESSSLPKYPPNKEIDAKVREESLKRKFSGRICPSQASRRRSRSKVSFQSNGSSKLSFHLEETWIKTEAIPKCGTRQNSAKVDDEARLLEHLQSNAAIELQIEGQQVKPAFRGDHYFSASMPAVSCGEFKRPQKQKENQVSAIVHCKSRSRCDAPRVLESSNVLQSKKYTNSNRHDSGDKFGFDSDFACENQDEIDKDLMVHQWVHLGHPEPYKVYNCKRDEQSFKHCNAGYKKQGDHFESCGPLLNQSHNVDEFLEKH